MHNDKLAFKRKIDQAILFGANSLDSFFRSIENAAPWAILKKKRREDRWANRCARYRLLEQDPLGSLLNMEQIVATGQKLSLADWEFLAMKAHAGYAHTGKSIFQSSLYRALIAGLNAWWDLAKVATPKMYTGYFMSKLGGPNGCKTLPDALTKALSAQDPYISYNPERACSTLSVALASHSDDIDAAQLHDALKPFFPELLLLAKRGVYLQHSGEFAASEHTQTIGAHSAQFANNGCKLDINIAGSAFSAKLQISPNAQEIAFTSYPNLAEFMRFIDTVDEYGPVIHGTRFIVSSPKTHSSFEGYTIIYPEGCQVISEEEFAKLKHFLVDAKTQEPIRLITAQMQSICGDI